MCNLVDLCARVIGIAAMALLIASCVPSHKTSAIHATVVPQVFYFSQGGNAEYFHLEKKLPKSAISSLNADRNARTLLFVISGADCGSFAPLLPHYFRGLEGGFGDVKIFILQKRHISYLSHPQKCSDDFVSMDHPSQWLADQFEFIQQKISLVSVDQTYNRIVLLGISEGAEIAPLIAQKIPAITHLVLLSNGGMPPIDALKLQREKNGTSVPAFISNLNKIPEVNGVRQLGRSWKYWVQISKINQIENLLSLHIPILMAMGEEDPVVPVESAMFAKRQFEMAGKANLRVLIYAGAGHQLEADGINYLSDFFHKMDLWLGKM